MGLSVVQFLDNKSSLGKESAEYFIVSLWEFRNELSFNYINKLNWLCIAEIYWLLTLDLIK